MTCGCTGPTCMGVSLCTCWGMLSVSGSQVGASHQWVPVLKDQLRSELRRLEELERQGETARAEEAPRTPGTLGEIEELEQRLQGALDELAERREALEADEGGDDQGVDDGESR